MARSVGLSTMVQPPYSPELNPAAPVIEEARRWVEGRIFGSMEDKVRAVDARLSELRSAPERARSLAAWDSIEDYVQRFPAPSMALSQ